MPSLRHFKGERPSRLDPEHTCHAMGCVTRVPPRMFMCKSHWFQLPKVMRDAVWREYVPGQEERKDPTGEYLRVAIDAVSWLAKKEGRVVTAPKST